MAWITKYDEILKVLSYLIKEDSENNNTSQIIKDNLFKNILNYET